MAGQGEFQRGPCLRPRDRHASPFIGDGNELHLQFRPGGLLQELEVRHDLARLCRGRRQEIAGLSESRGGPVIEDRRIIIEHHAVARFADRQFCKTIDVNSIQEHRGIRSLHVDFAERRDV